MSDIPEGRYAIVMITEQGESKVTTCFERMSDYWEYLDIQRNMMQEAEDKMASMFGMDVDKGELN